MAEGGDVCWSFPDIFASHDSRLAFVVDILRVFKDFPPDTKLNCEDYCSILSFVVTDLPFNFVIFVCECVDPSITSGTMMAHRMEFGNFLLALPCCVLFPQFMHRFLALFKTADRLRRGIISRSLCLSTLREAFQTFIKPPKKEPKAEQEDEDDESEEDEKDETFENCQTTIDPQRLPTFDLIRELRRATEGLEESSVKTLLFVMWQKDPTLVQCRRTMLIAEGTPLEEPKEEEDHGEIIE